MSRARKSKQRERPHDPDPLQPKLELLDRLEELREELQELGITTIAELEERIANLESEIDDEPEDDGSL